MTKVYDQRYEYIEDIDWLRSIYKEELNCDISSVQFCQSGEDVWIKIVWNHQTKLGTKFTEEIINLDFIAEAYDVPELDKCIDIQTFRAEVAIEINAEHFFSAKETLLNTTPLFDK